MVKAKKKVSRKAGVKRAVASGAVATVSIGGHDIEIAPRGLAERVADVLRDASEEPALTAEEIASRLTGDWTPDDLETELRRAVDLHELGCDKSDEATVYYIIPPTPAAPVDEEQLLVDAREELARIMSREDRPRATRSLECILTAEEKTALRLRSGELRAQEVTELREVERLSLLLKAAKERAAALASLKDHEQDVAAAGREYRDVECHRIPLWHHGLAITLRADTSEEIEREPLVAAEERQGALFPAGAP